MNVLSSEEVPFNKCKQELQINNDLEVKWNRTSRGMDIVTIHERKMLRNVLRKRFFENTH